MSDSTRAPDATRHTNMRFEERRGGLALVCSCCPDAYGYVERGRFVIQSRHQHRTHSNALTPDELRKLAQIIETCSTINEQRAV
jgi:hypothetical protein